MQKYLSLFQITLQEIFAYRLNMFMWRVRQVFVFLIPFFIWSAVLGGGGDLYGYTFASVMTYLFGTTILRSLVMGSRTVDLGWMINSGYLTIPLMRPINTFVLFFVRDLADKLFNLGFMFLELPLIYLIFRPPIFLQSDPISIILFTVSIIMAILIYFYLNIIFGSLAFWSRDVWAPRFMLMVVMEFASGAMFPLDMLPANITTLIHLTPFPYLLYAPLKIYLGTDPQLYFHLLGSLAWVVILGIISTLIWRKGIKSYEAEGR